MLNLELTDQILSIIGGVITLIGVVIAVVKWLRRNGDYKKESTTGKREEAPSTQSTIENKAPSTGKGVDSSILFIDDKEFPIVSAIKGSGYAACKQIKDIKDINSPPVINADVIFVDINGVGRSLSLPSEGLDVASAIKSRFPQKKVIIYSSQPAHNITHPAIKSVDAILRKDAEFIEFLSLLEKVTA